MFSPVLNGRKKSLVIEGLEATSLKNLATSKITKNFHEKLLYFVDIVLLVPISG